MIRKLFLAFLFCSILISYAQAQGEKFYFSVRGGFTHNLYTAAPKETSDRSLYAPDGQSYQLIPNNIYADSEAFRYWSPGFNCGAYFNADGEGSGLSVGTELVYNNTKARYYANDGEYWLIEKNHVASFGLPVMWKIGELEDEQIYLFVGWEHLWNFKLRQVQEVSWTETKLKRTTSENSDDGELKKHGNIFFVGFNFKFGSVQLDFIPQTFFNKDFTYSYFNGDKPYTNQRGAMFMLRTSFLLPFQEDFISDYF